MNRTIYSVGQINAYIKNMFAQDSSLRRVSVTGEVSNCKYHSSGHIFFSLKDDTGVLNAVMFKSRKQRGLNFLMKNGDEVIVNGNIDVYERDGRYQLYAQSIELAGAGLLYQKFEALKKELEEMGMFAPEYKRPLPQYPKTVGIVTASTGAAIRDIVNIATRRNPYVQLILYPAQVQGSGAAQTIVAGIRALEAYGVDVMIIGRGGGSIEDLWPFNERIVAEAVFDCGVPVVSAVGHETDTTIADFVADLRAPTPSAAAELVVYDIREVLERLASCKSALGRAMEQKLAKTAEQKRHLALRLESLSPGAKMKQNRQRAQQYERLLREQMARICTEYRHQKKLYQEKLPNALQHQIVECRMTAAFYESKLPAAIKQRISDCRMKAAPYKSRLPAAIRQRVSECRMTAALYQSKLPAAMQVKYTAAKNRFGMLSVRLDAASPLKRLGGGYTYVTDEGGRAILSAQQLKQDMQIEARLPDGSFTAQVLQVDLTDPS